MSRFQQWWLRLAGVWPTWLSRRSHAIPESSNSAEPANGPSATSDTEKPDRTHLRILHVSDIHFGSTFDLSVWEYVAGLVKRERPDIVVCTGDIVDHGGLFMLACAKQEFEQLRLDTGVNFKLRTVPGNHDCGPWGNLKLPPFSWNYGLVFGDRAISTRWMPSYCRYRKKRHLYRWIFRLGATSALYAMAMLKLLQALVMGMDSSRQELMNEDDTDGVVFVYLDSNHQLTLATGSVDIEEVTRLKAKMLNMRDLSGATSFAPRVALVHHHPLPIPDARITEGLTSFEPFLVLRNSGVLLRELNRCDVDLILHGHKHYSSFSRLGYSLDYKTEGEIAVLAAGSAGVTHAEQGRNSVNFIDVFRSGRMAYTTIFFGAGAGKPVTELFRNSHFVHGMEMHKMRMHRRAVERQGQWIRLLKHDARVDAGGDVVVSHEVEGHHFDRDLNSSCLPVQIDVSMGRIAHNTLKLSEGSVRAGHKWNNKPKKPERSIRCSIEMGQHLSVSSSPCSYGYSCVGFNTYATTEWETIRAFELQERTRSNTGRTVGMESVAVVIRVPIQQLELSLQLPRDLVSPDPQVRVLRWRSYPDVPLDEKMQFSETIDQWWVYDSDSTQHETGRLVRHGDNWRLRISNPLVGHRYEIRWRVRDAVDLEVLTADQDEAVRLETEETTRRGRAELFRSWLLDLPKHQARKTSIEEFLKAFLVAVCEPSFQSPGGDPSNDLEVALFAYDSGLHELRLVAATSETDLSVDSALRVPLNEGVVGAAFKRAVPTYYVDPVLSGSRDYAAYLFDMGTGKGDVWRYVVALPIFASTSPFSAYPFDVAWSSATTIGVLTISSLSPASGLSALAEGVANGNVAYGALTGEPSEEIVGPPIPEALQSASANDSAVLGARGPVVDYPRFWSFSHLLVDALESPLRSGNSEEGGAAHVPV
ncbi:metallophosphoesterase [Hydrogenophaga aromaticivorans]|nr:metallophosphoesterase [Hydrogenophaga aromaticivorans]MBQ0917737.1 metallophosphoesterase [Hydrogenophaga aromaticivorans]